MVSKINYLFLIQSPTKIHKIEKVSKSYFFSIQNPPNTLHHMISSFHYIHLTHYGNECLKEQIIHKFHNTYQYQKTY